MKAAVEKDTVTRVITIKVVDGPILDISKSWHTKARTIQVERVRLTLVDGTVKTMLALGGVVLKSGAASTGQRGERSWRDNDVLADEDIKKAPEWAQKLWSEAPTGVTYWSFNPSLVDG